VADVGRTLSDAAGKEVLRIAQAVINNKVLYGGANDSVAVVLFGTTKTGNALHQEMAEGGEGDQYVDVLVVHGLQRISTGPSQLLRVLESEAAECGGGKSDFMDALLVAFDMLTKEPLPARNKVVVVSDFASAIKEVDEEFLGHVVGGLVDKSCKVELVSVAGPSQPPPEVNSQVMNHLKREAGASVDCAADEEDYAALREVKVVNPFSCGKQELEIWGQSVKIPITLYKKVTKSSLSKSLKATGYYLDGEEYRPVARQTEYRKADDKDGDVIQNRIKAYTYGKDLIPIDEATEEHLRQREDKSMRLLGFRARESFPAHSFLGECYVVVPEATNPGAQEALSSLVRAAEHEGQAGVVRFVVRNGNDPCLGALLPQPSEEPDVPDCFILCTLPFAEDLREYQFASLDSSEKWIPSEQELGLAKNIIEVSPIRTNPTRCILLPPSCAHFPS